MSTSDGFQRDSQASLGLSLNLASNNPFRNRAASPSSPFDDPPARPVSRNPFLDLPQQPVRSPGVMSTSSQHQSLTADEIFAAMTLDDKTRTLEDQKIKAAPSNQRMLPHERKPGQGQEENVRPEGSNRRRPSQAQEEAMRARKMQGRHGPSGSPSRRPPPQQRRTRRNSESSILDFDATPLTEEEKRMIAAKRRERERSRLRKEARAAAEGHEGREDRDKKESGDKAESRGDRERRDGKSSRAKSGRPSRRMDIIDQLDATSIYGTGLFHHDGPFDALNPHRNRGTSRRAPMQAFPKDSLNNSLGGFGPLNKRADHSAFMGQANDEAFREFNYSGRDKDLINPASSSTVANVFDPIARGDVVHGDESVGLGTSTFLEGTPAAKSAIVRHHKEQSQDLENGLQRKKSLAQRIRHINKGPRDYSAGGRMTNPDGAYGSKRSPTATGPGSESNPFFSEFGKGEEGFSVKPRDGTMSPGSPPPPPRRGSGPTNGGPLERRATTDATGSEETFSKPTGIIGRMKSLKGGRRPRNEPTAPPPNPPGNAI